MFKLGKPIRTFILNSRKAFLEAEEFLKQMNFKLGDVWHYDIHGIIAKKRERIKTSTYEHEDRPEIE